MLDFISVKVLNRVFHSRSPLRPAGDVGSRREPSLSEWETDSDPPTEAEEEEEEGGNKENMGDSTKAENKVNDRICTIIASCHKRNTFLINVCTSLKFLI